MKKDIHTLLLVVVLAITVYGILIVFKSEEGNNLITGGFISVYEQAKFFVLPIILVVLLGIILVICARRARDNQ